ncbi:uncharacterized protein EI97DRAFT_366930 [Westerdykella ornata]|uniref:Uncharacterized protein n=1 Tax=Westerdykella ornata TaxID=318751 RepID=A0A6A6K1D7_WESOR|nr:uncharacterized protein EI97DRAFT_366930 [Westerdykella ornata]KAF2281179.1 hypothetical protein EI97DRAFT_366930 [Westerdykella ornata]
MPALAIPSQTNAYVSPTDTSEATSEGTEKEYSSQSQTPDQPTVEPITPTEELPAPVSATAPPKQQQQDARLPPAATFIRQPPSLPISDDNPDAIALRSAIGILQLQREKSKRDIKALEQLKAAAIRDPEAFARHIQAQKAQTAAINSDILGPTLADTLGARSSSSTEAMNGSGRKWDDRKDSASFSPHDPPIPEQLPPIPQPQNIVRCPPINWAKYHIVGEPLDKMHEEQKKWPGASEPPRTQQGKRAPPHAVASPYSPFTDGVVDPTAVPGPRGVKKSPS